MPTGPSRRQPVPISGRDSDVIRGQFPEPGRYPKGRGGVYDSPERELRSGTTSRTQVPPISGSYHHAADGRGDIAGLRGDPYDRPLRSQFEAAQSRLRQDKASGALNEVAGRYRVLYGSHQLVRKGLRRSIADAYAAYVGQVVNLPEDTYGMALRALDRTFNTGGLPVGAIDQNIHTSPYTTSRVKRAQIFNTAHKIMRDLEGYVYDVSYYCPSELDQLQDMRRPASAAGESYKSRLRLGPRNTHLEQEAVGGTPRRPSSIPHSGATKRAKDGRVPVGHPIPSVNPITAKMRDPDPDLDPDLDSTLRPRERFPAPTKRRPLIPRPQTAPSTHATAAGGGRDEAAAAVAAEVAIARDVATTLNTAAEAEAAVRRRRGGEGPRQLDSSEDRIQRSWRRRGSSGMFRKTPPHYRVSKYYDHVSPTQEVIGLIRRRMLLAAEERAVKAAEASGGGADGGVRGSGGGGGLRGPQAGAQAASEATEKSTTVSGGRNLRATSRGGSPSAFARPLRPREDIYGRREGPQQQDTDPADTERIRWIIETAYELGLADVLGLEGPLPYARSERVYPLDHRRVFFEGLYSRPERYESYVPYAPHIYGDEMSPEDMAWTYDTPHRHLRSATAADRGVGGIGGGNATAAAEGATSWSYEYDDLTVDRLQTAAARRFIRQMKQDMYPRSRRLSP
ncbi:hypothetical protein VaNZ11_016393 [Volvox africanus]|uniref:Uncharacterized protein n=1 Tax=Volvox africanus TaxID=51714 RepID=A0ABQ5SQ82_9CHLO|nr:hypothetical protein VaNZ11_016393 [Volvox africanus]